ncbi:hypothetical protein [Rhodococcus indonesiensis]|uniref:hypothetical protein n=1 Tax=Rhodococcus indonesiensis TaxID=3055869 RepID=UPI0039F6A5D6
MTEIRVRVGRWDTRAPWWQGRRWLRGLELEIEGHGITQTYGTRDLDTARTMVLDYLAANDDTSAPSDITICWVDAGA